MGPSYVLRWMPRGRWAQRPGVFVPPTLPAPGNEAILHKRSLAQRIIPLACLSPARGLMWIVLDWAIIVGAGATAWRLQRPWVWPLAWLIIAARQHALLIIMHDAAHYLLLGKNLPNDVVADF